MVKYRTDYSTRIEKVEVIRETPKFVFVKTYPGHERKDAKMTSYNCYFDTWQEAKEYLIEKETIRIDSLESQLAEANKKLDKIKALSN